MTDDEILSREDIGKPPYGLDHDPSTIRRMVRNGQIPAPFKITSGKFGRLGWLKSEMDAWHEKRLANRQTYEKTEGPKPPQDERGRFTSAAA